MEQPSEEKLRAMFTALFEICEVFGAGFIKIKFGPPTSQERVQELARTGDKVNLTHTVYTSLNDPCEITILPPAPRS